MDSYEYLLASDGNGDAALMHVTAVRLVGSDTIKVDSVANVPTKFIGCYGTQLSSGFLDPATVRNFTGHLSGADLIIDDFEPGSVDGGNTEGQIVIIKPNTGWTNRVGTFIRRLTGFDTDEKEDITVGELVADTITVGGKDVGQLLPTGLIVPYAGATAPTGWMLCQGQAISRADNAALFTLIGTTYGVGNGTTTFNLPDLRGRVPFGQKTGDDAFDVLGETGGEKAHALTGAENGPHNHGVTDPGHAHGVYDPGHNHGSAANYVRDVGAGGNLNGTAAGSVWRNLSPLYLNASGTGIGIYGNTTGISIVGSGSGTPHNVLNPYQVVNYIIKA